MYVLGNLRKKCLKITDLNKEQCKLDGYELFDEHRQNMTRGGVAIYVSKSLRRKERKDLNVFQEGKFESCFIEITLRSKTLVIGEIYRVPGTNEKDFISEYEKIVEKIKKEKKIYYHWNGPEPRLS